MSAWIICGAGLLVGSLMLALGRSDDPLTRRGLRMAATGFAVLGSGLFSLVAFPGEMPDPLPLAFAITTVTGMSFVVTGIGAVAGRDHGWRVALGLSAALTTGVALAHAESIRMLGIALAGSLVVLAVLLGALVRSFIVRPQSTSERVLGMTLGAYVLVAVGRWVLTVGHDGPLEVHLLHVPEVWQGALLLVYAGLPVLVAALVFNLLNERLRDQLRDQAHIDLLTTALNRRALVERAPALIAQARSRGEAVGVVMLDLDRFKRVNDLHGHAAGDAVLEWAAGIVRRALPADALFARWGGEEFVVLLALPGMPEGRRLAESIRLAISEAHWADVVGAGHPITTSLGIALLHGGEALERALARADAALYRAKREGRDRVTAALATA